MRPPRLFCLFHAVGLVRPLRLLRLLRLIRLAVVLLLPIATACKKEPGPEEEKPPIIKQTVTCENTCIFKNDGECDDGGRLATSDFCAWGTDCNDCGERIIVEVIEQD